MILGLRREGPSVIGIGRQPGREGPGFLGVVGAQDAGDVGVVVGVAVVFGGEEGAAEGVVTGGRLRQEVGKVVRHCDVMVS